jgi:hypothetical protein
LRAWLVRAPRRYRIARFAPHRQPQQSSSFFRASVSHRKNRRRVGIASGHETFFVERASVVLRDGATHAGRMPAHWRRAVCPMHPADAIGPHCWRLARLSAPAKGFPRRLTLRRDHLLLGEAQNGGAIALAGRPGSLEAIDRRSGQPKIVVALRAPVRLHEAAGRRGGERLVSGGGDFNADHSDTVFHRSRCRLAQDLVPHCFGRMRPRQQIERTQ